MPSYNDHHHARSHAVPRAHGEMSPETKMGLLLSLIGLVAFGAYAVFFLIGFVQDLAS